jgi:hypothetical protein
MPRHRELLRTLSDGGDPARVAAASGILSTAATSDPDRFLTGPGALEFTLDPAGGSVCAVTFALDIPEHWAGLFVMADCLTRWRRDGEDFGARYALRISDPAVWTPGVLTPSPDAAIFPDMTETPPEDVAAPAIDAFTGWRHARAFFRVRRAGPVQATVFLDALARPRSGVAWIDSLRLHALNGEGPGES